MTGNIAIAAIDNLSSVFSKLAKDIWDHPETAYQEQYASRLLADFMSEQGFSVELGYAGLPTAIRAVWGSGHPVIGLLGEYDALPGLSQKRTIVKEAAVPGGPGHGCGHNTIAVCKAAAAVAMKAEMEAKHLPGTIVFYGCPAEEVLTGKVFMARAGAFRELDLAFAWHPMQNNVIYQGTWSGLNSAIFHFKGVTAHAAYDPHNGRSALDAVELMNVGANYLREHVTDDVRIHYCITEGGSAPNIVHDKASVWYYVRALSRDVVDTTYERLLKVANGAAMMTETQVEVEFLGGCYNTMANPELVRLVHETMEEIPCPKWTEEDIALCRALNEQSPQFAKMVRSGQISPDCHIDSLIPAPTHENSFASTDVGDVMHIVPAVFFGTASVNIGAPSHSWQFAATTGSDVGIKGMLHGAKILAVSAVKAMEDESIVARARESFEKAMNGKQYVCPIPDDVPIPN